jgi:multisubunit Na+/H+ antiporter MnhB subunit
VTNGVVPRARQTARPGRLRAARSARYGLASLLIVLAVLGLRAATPAVTWRGPLKNQGFEVAVAVEAILAILLLILRYTSRRSRKPGHPADTVRLAVRRAMGVAMAIVVMLVLAGAVGIPYQKARLNPLGLNLGFSGSILRPPKHSHGRAVVSAADVRFVFYVIAGLAVVVTVLGIVSLVVLRKRRRRTWLGHAAELSEDYAASLLDAVESARRAMQAVDDAQAAIIACYLAMETSLAKAGTARRQAETPDELLARAERAGLLRGPAAGTLTRLFYEARFSSHHIPQPARADALQALAAISAELRRSAEQRNSAEQQTAAADLAGSGRGSPLTGPAGGSA